jgi:hypothetical protein
MIHRWDRFFGFWMPFVCKFYLPQAPQSRVRGDGYRERTVPGLSVGLMVRGWKTAGKHIGDAPYYQFVAGTLHDVYSKELLDVRDLTAGFVNEWGWRSPLVMDPQG